MARIMEATEDENPLNAARPVLSEQIRRRLGMQLQAMYEPVIDEAMDPRIAELLGQLEGARRGDEAP